MRTACLLITCSALCFAQSELFPLAIGNQWEYERAGTQIRETRTVVAADQTGGQTWYRLEIKQSGNNIPAHSITISLQGLKLQIRSDDGGKPRLWADFGATADERYAIAGAEWGEKPGIFTSNTAAANHAIQDGIEVRYVQVCCDRGKISETFKRGIGLTEFTNSGFANQTWRLIRARVGGKEMTFEEPRTK